MERIVMCCWSCGKNVFDVDRIIGRWDYWLDYFWSSNCSRLLIVENSYWWDINCFNSKVGGGIGYVMLSLLLVILNKWGMISMDGILLGKIIVVMGVVN